MLQEGKKELGLHEGNNEKRNTHCFALLFSCLVSHLVGHLWKEVFVKELTYVVMIPCSLFFTPRMWSHKNYNCNLTPRHYNSKLRRLGNVTCNDNPVVVQCSSRQSKKGENNAWRNFYTTRSFSLQSDITPGAMLFPFSLWRNSIWSPNKCVALLQQNILIWPHSTHQTKKLVDFLMLHFQQQRIAKELFRHHG